MKNLSTYTVGIVVFAVFGFLALLNLPLGWPRSLAAGVLVGAWVLLCYFAVRAYNRKP